MGRSSIDGIVQVAITVRDVPRAVAFYRDALGLPQLPIPAPPTLAFLRAGDVRIMLSQPEGDFRPGGGTVLYYKVADIQAAVAEMTSRGVTFPGGAHLIAKLPDRDVWLAEFRDPDGNTLALMSEVTS
ncbi:MAG TPA: VOC family protein [Gemmatimonadaceae bacterium]|nr:VOC family protein [Gemmatimonadaceae bacterium]